MAHPSGLPYADASHEKCAPAVEQCCRVELYAKGLSHTFSPRPHHKSINMYIDGLSNLRILEEVDGLTDIACGAAFARLVKRIYNELGDLDAAFVWRVPLEIVAFVNPIVHADPNGDHIDFVSDARVFVDGATLVFKAYARYMIEKPN